MSPFFYIKDHENIAFLNKKALFLRKTLELNKRKPLCLPASLLKLVGTDSSVDRAPAF